MTPVSAKLLIRSQAKPGFHGGSDGKESACNVGDLGSIPGSERAPGEGNGNPLQYSSLSMGFLRQESWNGLPFPSSGDLPDPGLNLRLPHWQVDSLPLSHQGSPNLALANRNKPRL